LYSPRYLSNNSGCFKRFSQSSNLTAHEKTHINTQTSANKFYTPVQPTVPNPIFTVNPLKLMVNNIFSGSMNYNNLNQLNFLYSILKNSFNSDANGNPNQTTTNNTGLIFNVNNPNNPNINNKPFLLSKHKFFKGQKIFNICKETNPYNRRKSVKIVYNGNGDDESNGRDNINGELIDNFENKGEIEEEQYENGENIEKQGVQIYEDETFDWITNNFLSK